MQLLFLHGAGLTRAAWQPQLWDVADEFEVSAVDHPGHGDSCGERFSFPVAVGVVQPAVDL